MKAYEARDIVYRENKKLKGVLELNALIKSAAEQGKFKLTTRVHDDWGSYSALKDYYKEQGYKAHTFYEQTSPNDSDNYISLDWSE